MPRYAELVYNGFWFSPERLALQVGVGGWPGGGVQRATASNQTGSWDAVPLQCVAMAVSGALHCAPPHPPLACSLFPPRQELVDKTQQFVEGTVRLKLYKARLSFAAAPAAAFRACPAALWGQRGAVGGARKLLSSRLSNPPTAPLTSPLPQGNVIVAGRKSPYSLYDSKISSFEDDQVGARFRLIEMSILTGWGLGV